MIQTTLLCTLVGWQYPALPLIDNCISSLRGVDHNVIPIHPIAGAMAFSAAKVET